MFKELCYRKANISAYQAQQGRRDIATAMKRYCRHPTVWMAELFVRTLLTNLNKAEFFKNSNDLARFQDGHIAHSGYRDRLDSDELPFQMWLTFRE